MAQPIILITGCSSGIGLVSAHYLRTKGWRVLATARRPRDVERLKEQGFEACQLDLMEMESITMALDWLLHQTNGRLDALFNNGAFAIPGAVEDLPYNALVMQFAGGFFGWHELTRQVLRLMRRQGYGKIIQNSSLLGLAPMPYRGAYVANKFALEGLTDVLRLELAGSDIWVSLIEPGPIMPTNFRQNAFDNFRNMNFGPSPHGRAYEAMINRFNGNKPEPFTLPPERVAETVWKILESPRPKARYYITKATWLMANLRRFLPSSLYDRLVLWLNRREAQRHKK